MILKLQNAILEMIAKGEPLGITIEQLCRKVEKVAPRVTASVQRFDGGRLHGLAGPSLPSQYLAAIDNLEVGPLVGSCGTAAYLGETVVVTDIGSDPRWHDFKALIMPLGFKACWSSPIKSGERVVGTFAFYYRERTGPSAAEQELVDACVHLCSIAIDREERVMERQRLIYRDALTGLSNRARFDQLLTKDLSTSGRAWGILLADVDNLKLVNDTFGHAAGDALIKVVADRISAVAGAESAFRLGGDEFAIIVSGEKGIDLNAKAMKILEALSPPCSCDGHVIFPAATIGGALAEENQTPDEIRRNADVALYHAKERSRGQFVEFSPGLGTALIRRSRAVRDVGVALAEDRIDPHYQPIVRLDTHEVVGFEALCRMTTASGELIAAAHFREATKDAHVAAELTQRMFTRVASDIRQWLDSGLPVQHVGINLSAADFRGGNLRDRLCQIFGCADVPLKHIILEVTESVYLGQRDDVVAKEIKALRSEGVRVALDDFGTGYASLTNLLTTPVDVIKIDKSFVDRMVPGDAGLFIVDGLMGIARNLGIRVVAVGIETESQVHQVSKLGCILGQGYLFSKALDRTLAAQVLEQRGQRLSESKPPAKAVGQ
ncbi:diguanylate cyclase (GGDEF) domain-containing protein [Rhizobium leguminosarum bv. trifolii WSM2297]|uniref:Diguanylate cyclase (GGDEF) domain-containing protein n=1 Tax=Rhizobium leguminosarum bv. trifolii WSM2297 TaxID=754762 RepID=J0WFS6_RHILT|nr:EAL domain-containing protein [Rhizobium leguminosarum]EJC84253.1 diguanylate cyclase (GGDEF) domain-containing protein [Rhizobium leguminosarum bv. trifolii WSM2297]